MTDPTRVRRRESSGLILAALAAAALGWWVLARPHHGSISGPAGWPGELALAAAMWGAMLLAMMLPPALPWILAYQRLAPDGVSRRQGTGLFVAGYGTVWAIYALTAAALQVGLQRAGLLEQGGALPRALAGAVLVGVGLYQLTPVKAACLRKCRSPIAYFLARWQDGPAGAFRMGAAHGRTCVACCWALMAAALALGLMSLAWMAVLTALMAAEKLAPGGQALSRWAGWAAVALGVLIWAGVP